MPTDVHVHAHVQCTCTGPCRTTHTHIHTHTHTYIHTHTHTPTHTHTCTHTRTHTHTHPHQHPQLPTHTHPYLLFSQTATGSKLLHLFLTLLHSHQLCMLCLVLSAPLKLCLLLSLPPITGTVLLYLYQQIFDQWTITLETNTRHTLLHNALCI